MVRQQQGLDVMLRAQLSKRGITRLACRAFEPQS